MLEAEVQVFAVSVEAYFGRPRPFAKDDIDNLAGWLTDTAEGFALRPDQVRVRQMDLVFDYELSASFFGGNATFKRDAEKSHFSARGARTRQDAEWLLVSMTRFVKALALPDHLPVTLFANAHAALSSENARETFLAAFRPSDEVTGPAALGYARVEAGRKKSGSRSNLLSAWRRACSLPGKPGSFQTKSRRSPCRRWSLRSGEPPKFMA